MKRTILALLIVTGSFVMAQAQKTTTQFSLIGIIQDSVSGKPLSYATVSLFDTTGNIIASTWSPESGTFNIPLPAPGLYRLEISSVGYRTKHLPVNIVSHKTIQLGNIMLMAGSDHLKEVVVVSRRRLVEQKPGMLVYNAENDIANKGGTAADVLRKAPILTVDAQGNVNMRGSSNLKILINGKYSGQIARSAADALNMMPADMIKSVEIITTPSAKYDAEGAAGVINIITKKGKSDWSGTLETSISNLEQMLNPRISFSTGKWSFNLVGHIHRLRQKSGSATDRTSFANNTATNRLLQLIEQDNSAPHGSADLSLQYTIDEVSELSLGINSWFGKWPHNSNINSTVYTAGGGIAEQYKQAISSQNNYLGSDINFGYSRRLKKLGQSITLLAQGSPSRDLSKYDAVQTTPTNSLLYRELNDSKTNNLEWTFQADYVHPLNSNGTVNLELGAKAILRKVSNRYNVIASDAQQAELLIAQPERSDNFKYSQDVTAGYVLFKINLKNNWYLESGARLEATYLKGNFVHTGAAFDNNFLNFIPSATISKKLDENNTFNLSYTKRLTRPYIWDLNPNVNTSDPKNIESGNPELQPEIAHQVELSYGLNTGKAFFMNTAIYWKQTNRAIVEFMETNANGISFTSKQNLAGNKQYGLNLSATSNLTDKLSLNGNINIDYFDYKSQALDIFRSGWGTEFNLNTIYKLPHYFSVQAFGEYKTRAITLLGTLGRVHYYSFAGKKEIKKARLTITLAAVNPFSKYITQTDQKQRPQFISTINNRYYNRALKLTVNWEFGGKARKIERKRVDNSDVNVQGKG